MIGQVPRGARCDRHAAAAREDAVLRVEPYILGNANTKRSRAARDHGQTVVCWDHPSKEHVDSIGRTPGPCLLSNPPLTATTEDETRTGYTTVGIEIDAALARRPSSRQLMRPRRRHLSRWLYVGRYRPTTPAVRRCREARGYWTMRGTGWLGGHGGRGAYRRFPIERGRRDGANVGAEAGSRHTGG